MTISQVMIQIIQKNQKVISDKGLEELIHKNIRNKNKLNKIGNIKYLLDYIGSLDYYLKEYLESHIYLLDKLSKDLNLVKNNWDNYINRINEQRVSIVYQEVDKFMEEYGRYNRC